MLSRRSISHTKPFTALYERTSVMEALYTRTADIGSSIVHGLLEESAYPYLTAQVSVNVLPRLMASALETLKWIL